MIKALFISALYSLAFSGIVYLILPIAGLDSQETNLLYLFVGVIVFAGLIAPALEECIESHNQKAEALIKAEHEELEKKLRE